MHKYLYLFLFISLISGALSDVCGTFSDDASNLYFYPDGIDLRTGALNPGRPSYIDFQGLRLQINATNALLQVRNKIQVIKCTSICNNGLTMAFIFIICCRWLNWIITILYGVGEKPTRIAQGMHE